MVPGPETGSPARAAGVIEPPAGEPRARLLARRPPGSAAERRRRPLIMRFGDGHGSVMLLQLTDATSAQGTYRPFQRPPRDAA
jgi:hypothetical protein